ncbi:transmembrane protein [Wufeng Myotis altarium paramyxovirus 1]|uniref:Transmembrane protein n=1 Tax=Wufeng Myotis altarium paramyxovirus 1 TaxID=2928981 RepID=A0A8T9KLF8_9MONO|nr:transmembrane protein [Wufeng Myotis altarium paramyxovirus 1]
MNYYRSTDESEETPNNNYNHKAKSACKIIFQLAYIIMSILTLSCAIINVYNIHNYTKHNINHNELDKSINTKLADINRYLVQELKPRIMVIDKALTYQLPTAIMKAFEVSHLDLRSTLDQIMFDMEKLINLYKAILGFQDDWSVNPEAQRLKCYWDEDTVEDHALFKDNATLEMLQRVNETVAHLAARDFDFDDVTNNIRNAFHSFLNFIRPNQNNDDNNTTVISVKQRDYYQLINTFCITNNCDFLTKIMFNIILNALKIIKNNYDEGGKDIWRVRFCKICLKETAKGSDHHNRIINFYNVTWWNKAKERRVINRNQGRIINVIKGRSRRNYPLPGIYKLPTYTYNTSNNGIPPKVSSFSRRENHRHRGTQGSEDRSKNSRKRKMDRDSQSQMDQSKRYRSDDCVDSDPSRQDCYYGDINDYDVYFCRKNQQD